MKYVGVDACKRGWIAIGFDEGNHWRMDVFSDIAEIWSQCKSSRLILVDIPIGLNEHDSDERGCDKAARKLLGHKRGSSVFPVPCRQAVYADTKEASEVNREITGRKLSTQSLGIIRKIRQMPKAKKLWKRFMNGNRHVLAALIIIGAFGIVLYAITVIS